MRDDPELAAVAARPDRARGGSRCWRSPAALGAAAGAGDRLLLGVAAPADVSPLLALQLFAAVIVAGDAPVPARCSAFAVIVAIPRLADALGRARRVRGARPAA